MQSLPNQVPPTNYCHGKILRAFPRAQNEPKKPCFARTFRPGSQPNQHKTKAQKTRWVRFCESPFSLMITNRPVQAAITQKGV